ncbi:predicted protein [Naegleria gruberi]|uniref:non-specific serine/threonine protein kinase n=1 Tax=Naegleria gruberi TaxID=5762 RepID=D2VLK5_NAEGR|nr:uncharacterized protein NAEGRDRAFT_69813 [Naegleria gruberi]EFC42325.1 predicted protein [Naegleria gruberi]|eukprot:XP_002675069.1 predicted protein [Naegleria gruberi strain NEG-M]
MYEASSLASSEEYKTSRNIGNYYPYRTSMNIDEVLESSSSIQRSTRSRSPMSGGIQPVAMIYINEKVSYDNTSTCNITFPCSNLGQALDYLASLDEESRLGIIILQVYFMSDVTTCENRWRNELNPTMEVFFLNYPTRESRTFDCKGLKYFITDFVNSNSKLGINIFEMRFENTSFKHALDMIGFSGCVLDTVSIIVGKSSKVTITDSLVLKSGINCIEGYLETSNSVFRSTQIHGFNNIGSAVVHPIIMQDTKLLEKSTLSLISFRITISQFTISDSSLEINSAPYIGITNFTASNSLLKFEVVNRMEMSEFEIFNNVIPVLFSGINILIMNNGTIRDCDVTSDGALAFRTILSMNFQKLKFIRNRRGMFADNVRTMSLKRCEFSQNYQGVNLQNFENNSHATSSFYFCTFIDNYYPDGNGGAVQMISQDSLRFFACKFENNYARNGGAIYSTSETSIEASTFRNNSAVLYGDCSEITCGNGGSFYGKSFITLEDVEFSDNRAIKGGACFFNHVTRLDSFGNQLFHNNVASFGGDDIFLHDTFTQVMPSAKFAQSNIGSLKLKSNYESSKNISVEDSYLKLYPGQSISFRFELFDMYGNQIRKIQSSPRFVSSNHGIVVKTVVNSTTNISLNSFSYEVNEKIPSDDFQVLVSFDENFKDYILNIRPTHCPFGYSFKRQFESEFSQYACVKENYEAIIASSVMGTVLIVIVLTGCSIAAYFIGTRMHNLYKREQAEKSLAKKLIDKQFIFGEQSELTESLLHSNGKAKQLKSQCDNMIIPLTDIEIISKIGEGSNGVVYKARWHGTFVALKTLKINSLSEEENEEFEHEAALLSSLKHPSIVSFYGISVGVNVKYMIVEFMPNGSLDHLIRECKSGKVHITLRQKINIILGIANGLLYLHNLKPLSIIHRDIKPGNILLDHSYQAKVSDFGLSKLTSNNGSSTMTSNLGTVLYMAPEVIMEGEYDISHKLDVYSFAIIMYELFFEEAPFSSGSSKLNRFSKDEKEVKNLLSIPWLVAKGERPKIPFTTEEELSMWIEEFIKDEKDLNGNVSLFKAVQDYIDLMKKCWTQNPSERPTFAEVVIILSRMLSNYWKGI